MKLAKREDKDRSIQKEYGIVRLVLRNSHQFHPLRPMTEERLLCFAVKAQQTSGSYKQMCDKLTGEIDGISSESSFPGLSST